MARSSGDYAPLLMYYMLLGAMLQLALIAVCVLCAMGLRTIIRRRTVFLWTEYVGCVACILQGVFLLYYLWAFPLVI